MAQWNSLRHDLYEDIRNLNETVHIRNELRNMADTLVDVRKFTSAIIHETMGYLAMPGLKSLVIPMFMRAASIIRQSTSQVARDLTFTILCGILEDIDHAVRTL